ncbi:hypothetical protein [uncultured Paludibaculum sp.]|uniref:hypothetical protein n=1 Tax=uncultured Paludibaculum sp. TaxID=1765020 RepID=UPI002AAC1C6A|nr:hypothetical protein [uncultured Paludibaculum sp.]
MRGAWAYLMVISSIPGIADAQRLYRKEMDAAAQQAVKAMEKVGSKDLFDRMLANLSIQSKQDFDTAFAGVRRQTRDRIQTWDNWCAVHQDMVRTMKRIGYVGFEPVDLLSVKSESELKARCAQLLERTATSEAPAQTNWAKALDEIKAAKTALNERINEVKNPPGTQNAAVSKPDESIGPGLETLIAHLGDLSEVETALQEIRDSPFGGRVEKLTEPAGVAVSILKQLSAAYQEYKTRRDEIAKVRAQLREFRVAMLKVAVLKLTAQEEHFKRLMAIEARRMRELEAAASAFEEYRDIIRCERQQSLDLDLARIDDSLLEAGTRVGNVGSTVADAYRYSSDLQEVLSTGGDTQRFCREHPAPSRLRVQRLARALFQAASVQARAGTPQYLAELRRAQEEQRYSIIQSSLEARAYETLTNTGVRRLAMLYAGGIKPEQIAQLVFQAGQLAGVSVIAFQQ